MHWSNRFFFIRLATICWSEDEDLPILDKTVRLSSNCYHNFNQLASQTNIRPCPRKTSSTAGVFYIPDSITFVLNWILYPCENNSKQHLSSSLKLKQLPRRSLWIDKTNVQPKLITASRLQLDDSLEPFLWIKSASSSLLLKSKFY